MRPVLRRFSAALGCAVVLLAGAWAHADIKSFNTAMHAGDFKAAAAAAASTWPTLDKSRDDIALIAREFGFAAYMAGDFAAAHRFGEAAVSSGAALGEDAEDRAASEVLRDVAAHKLSPSAATRDKLYRALQTRTSQQTLDLISYVAADVATTYDFGRGAWAEAEASAALGLQLSEAGGEGYHVYVLRYGLLKVVAEHMRTRDVKSFEQLASLKDRARLAINAAATDDSAEPFMRIYWEIDAWRSAVGQYLVGKRKMKWPEAAASPHQPGDRAMRVLGISNPEGGCPSFVDMRRDIEYPASALYKGGFGVVIIRIDVDADGMASNPEILAAVPEKPFGEAVLKSVRDMRFKRGKNAPSGCPIAQTGRVITFHFRVG